MPHQNKANEDEDEKAAVRDRARAAVETYRVVIAPCKGGGFIGYTLEVPAVVSFAPTRHECLDKVLEDQGIALTAMLEYGIESPGATEKRDLLLNLRVSAEEKARLRQAAKQSGRESLSDYVRIAALASSARSAGEEPPPRPKRRRSEKRSG